MRFGVLRRLQIGMMLFGVTMGFVFPVYARFFVEFKPGLQFWFNAGCIVAGVVVGGFSFFLVRIILLRPLHSIATGCNEIVAGRVGGHIDFISPDTVGDIVAGFNAMTLHLGEVFKELQKGSVDLSQVALKLSGVNQQLLGTLDEQGINVTEINSVLDGLSITVNQVSGKLASTADLSRDISHRADAAMGLLDDSNKIMKENTQSLDGIIGLMSDLGGQSRDIAGILLIIDEIAQQTRLLSLNAAVEAARAGQHGRGFAVVADEVKVLADRTAQSTRKISERVESFQKGVSRSISGVQDHAVLTDRLQEKLDNSAAEISLILEQVGRIDDMALEASRAAAEQESALGRIQNSVSRINSAFADMLLAADSVIAGGTTLNQFTSHMQKLLVRFHRAV